MSAKEQKNYEKSQPDVLTRIHPSYTLSATNERDRGEIENLMIRHFLETLAEVALSVASRKEGENQQ